MRIRLAPILLAILLSAATAMAGTYSLDWSTNKEPVSYQPGETMTFHIQLLEDGKPLAGKTLKWQRTGDDQKTDQGKGVSSETAPLEITTSIDQPGFVRIQVGVFNDDGSPVKDARNKVVRFDGGAGAQPTRLEGYPEPDDFDTFWKAQKARLAAVPLEASLKPVASPVPGFEVFDVKVDCAGGMPVSGYFSMPVGAKAKSLPAAVSYRGYGVTGASPACRSGWISLQINAHGIENGREPAYYDALKSGKLRAYAFSVEENSKPETAYFNGMMLRVIRSLEFIKSRPEWDGKTLTVSGGSQGGLQCLSAAGLDSDVTECTAHKPWCCDLGGVQLNRLRGWRPDFTDALGYYDPVNMAKRIQCKTSITSGLGDYVCPPSGVSVLYNNIKAPKTIQYIQGSTHGYNPPNPKIQTLTSP